MIDRGEIYAGDTTVRVKVGREIQEVPFSKPVAYWVRERPSVEPLEYRQAAQWIMNRMRARGIR